MATPSNKRIPTCEKSGCKETEVDVLHVFGNRAARVCEDHMLLWVNCDEARELGHKSKLHAIAVDAAVNAGAAEAAQKHEKLLYAQETENRAFFDAWLKRIG